MGYQIALSGEGDGFSTVWLGFQEASGCFFNFPIFFFLFRFSLLAGSNIYPGSLRFQGQFFWYGDYG